MYVRKKFFCGDSIEIEEGHTGRYGAPGMKRAKRKKPTPEQMAKQNQWKKERDIRRLLKENFTEHDYWITLTYRPEERPKNTKGAKQQFQNFLRKMRGQYKKRKKELKYIGVMETGSKGAVHYHIVINRIEGADKLVAELWTYGRASFGLLYLEGGFRKLANYIAKEQDEKERKWYSRSRNLKKPKMKKEIMKRKTFTREIQVPKGYYLEKESVYEGVNPVTGHLYRHYTLIRTGRRC